MNEISPQTETQLIQQIWKILNEFRMNHFFTKPQDMIDVGDFDEMMDIYGNYGIRNLNLSTNITHICHQSLDFSFVMPFNC